jgi:hypothetical protein
LAIQNTGGNFHELGDVTINLSRYFGEVLHSTPGVRQPG